MLLMLANHQVSGVNQNGSSRQLNVFRALAVEAIGALRLGTVIDPGS